MSMMLPKAEILELAMECKHSYNENFIKGRPAVVHAEKKGNEFGYVLRYAPQEYTVVIRGSDMVIDEKDYQRITFMNWLRNFYFFPVIDGCHNGVYKSYLKLSYLMAYIRDDLLPRHDIKRINITGHSKGAAISHLFYKKLRPLLSSREIKVNNYMFSPMRFLKKDPGAIDLSVHSLFLRGDLVPKLPPFFHIPGVKWMFPRIDKNHGFFGNITQSHSMINIITAIRQANADLTMI